MSEDRAILVTSSYDHTIKFWSTATPTWETNKIIDVPQDQVVYRMKISQDKKYLVCAATKGVKIYDLSDECKYVLKGDIDYGCNCTSVGFRGEGEWFFGSGEDGSLRVHDLRLTGSQTVYNNPVAINDVLLSHTEGELIAADESGRVIIYDLVASKVRHIFQPNNLTDVGIKSLALSASSAAEKYLCAANSAGCVYVWRVSSDQDLVALPGPIEAHKDYILKVAISPNNKYMATCSADKNIKIFNIDKDKGFEEKKTLLGHTRWVWDCEFISDSSKLISVSTDNVLKLWDLNNGNQLKSSSQHQKGVISVALHDRPVDSNSS